MARRVAVIGGGLVGLGTARALQRRGVDVQVLEKEAGVGQHQSAHNSGVLHAGLYYSPGSAKARLAVRGIREMTAFCQEHGIAHEICGKLVVATGDEELPRLRELQRRGELNGLSGLRWLTPAEAREIEPNVACVAALHVPEEGIADYRAVSRTLAEQIRKHGGEVRINAGVRALRREAGGWIADAVDGVHRAAFIVNCAGLHADRVARMAGEDPGLQIVPFRGEYFKLRRDRADLVRHLIYPVPNPAFPFLGVHFTRMIGGGVECGPNAVLALSREGYRWRDVRLGDAVETLRFSGLWRFLARFPRMSGFEVARSLSRRLFTRSLQRLVPAIREEDLEPGGAGVRAQAMDRRGALVEDFSFVARADALHVLNAPSPAATASLAIGEEIAEQVLAALARR